MSSAHGGRRRPLARTTSSSEDQALNQIAREVSFAFPRFDLQCVKFGFAIYAKRLLTRKKLELVACSCVLFVHGFVVSVKLQILVMLTFFAVTIF